MNVISELQRKLGLLRTGKVDDLLFAKLGVTFPCDSTAADKIKAAIQACKFNEPYQSAMISAVVVALLAKTPVVEPPKAVRQESAVRLVPMMEPITLTGPVTPLPGVAGDPEGDVALDDTTELPVVEEPKPEPKKRSRKGKKNG